MIRSIFKVLFIVLVIFMAQTQIFADTIFPTTPNFLLITIISCGLLCKPNLSLAIGFFCGLLFDVTFGQLIGFYAFMYFAIGFLMTKIAGTFYRESFLIPSVLMVSLSLMTEIIIFIFNFLFRGRFEIAFYWDAIIVPKMILNGIFGIVLYRLILILVKWYEKRIEEKEKKII